MTRGFASSTIASSSRFGSRDETGCGVAPSFQHATTAATNSMPFGSAIVTKSPCTTPRDASSRAMRFASRSSSPRVNRPGLVSDGEVVGITAPRGRRCAARTRSEPFRDSVPAPSGRASSERRMTQRPPRVEQHSEGAEPGHDLRVGDTLGAVVRASTCRNASASHAHRGIRRGAPPHGTDARARPRRRGSTAGARRAGARNSRSLQKEPADQGSHSPIAYDPLPCHSNAPLPSSPAAPPGWAKPRLGGSPPTAHTS